MSVLKRVRDITVATLNDMLEKSEDPVQLIDQYITDRKQKIHEIKTFLAQYKQHANSVKVQYLNAAAMAEKRENQAALAIKAGEETLARLALQEKIQYDEQAEQYKALLDEAEQSIEEAQAQLAVWEEEMLEVQSKRHYYVTKLQSLQLQEKFRNNFSQVNSGKQAVRRLEDRLNDMEWELKAKLSLSKEEITSASAGLWTKLDQDLAALKAKISKEER